MKLNIGCWNRRMEGFINIDIVNHKGVDIVDDVSTLNRIENSSCDLIYASHVLEHFDRIDYRKVLRAWVSKLKNGGTLRVAVPDFGSVCTMYAINKNIKEMIGMVVGTHDIAYEGHKMIFDCDLLTSNLEDVGLTNVKRWDWRKTEHSHVDDYSQSFLPHMDKINGRLMSLNLEGTK